MDYIGLYYVHCWDGQVPVSETVQEMNGLIKKGKIRHWGIRLQRLGACEDIYMGSRK
ncbi:aldo/keto reductase [Solibacillus silvestris]|uniref:aldo/keto reductase n=1 Tax=Solibacillus silvestris TaxID=76853 RepID=UPI003F7EA97D